jgi:hypothetical protein
MGVVNATSWPIYPLHMRLGGHLGCSGRVRKIRSLPDSNPGPSSCSEPTCINNGENVFHCKWDIVSFRNVVRITYASEYDQYRPQVYCLTNSDHALRSRSSSQAPTHVSSGAVLSKSGPPYPNIQSSQRTCWNRTILCNIQEFKIWVRSCTEMYSPLFALLGCCFKYESV